MSQAKPRKTRSTRSKKKGKIIVKQKAELRKKSAQPKDSLKQAPTQMPRDNGINMRIKIKRKR